MGHCVNPTLNHKVSSRKRKNRKSEGTLNNRTRMLRGQLKSPSRYKLRKREVYTIAGNNEFDPRPNDESQV